MGAILEEEEEDKGCHVQSLTVIDVSICYYIMSIGIQKNRKHNIIERLHISL